MPRDIEAKPFTYRSQLEHEWALFFARGKRNMIYEPCYYGNWLPDFEDAKRGILFEIKPTIQIADEEIPKIRDGIMTALLEKKDVFLLVGNPSKFKAFKASSSLSWSFPAGDNILDDNFTPGDFGLIDRLEHKEKKWRSESMKLELTQTRIEEVAKILGYSMVLDI